MENWRWLTSEYERPKDRFKLINTQKPAKKPSPPVKILPNMTGIRTDEQYEDFMDRSKNDTVVINYGSSWCAHCHKLFPHFLTLSNAFPSLKYAVAQVDYLHNAVKSITYTPTFAIFRKGRKVDEFYGANQQQLRDRLWLHADVPK